MFAKPCWRQLFCLKQANKNPNKTTNNQPETNKQKTETKPKKTTLIHSTFFLYMAIEILKIQFQTSAFKKIIHLFNLMNLENESSNKV